MSLSLFQEIKNAVLDLQSSQLQTYERPLKKLVKLLDHQSLAKFNAELTANIDLDAFLSASNKTGGSMVGSRQLLWPDDDKEILGTQLLLIKKFAEDPNLVTVFAHDYFYAGRSIMAGIHSLVRGLIIPFTRDYQAYVEAQGVGEIVLQQPISKKVFIVHGHDEGARESVARFLEKLGLEAIILHEQANQGRTVIEKVEAHGQVGFAVVLLTPDDEGRNKGGDLEPRARQNVLLELGYFIGRLGRDKVCALKRGKLEIPSDFAGVVWEAMDDSGAWRQALSRELQAAGYNIDWNKVMRG